MTLKEFHHYSLTPFWPLIIDLKDLNPIYPHSLAPTLKVTMQPEFVTCPPGSVAENDIGKFPGLQRPCIVTEPENPRITSIEAGAVAELKQGAAHVQTILLSHSVHQQQPARHTSQHLYQKPHASMALGYTARILFSFSVLMLYSYIFMLSSMSLLFRVSFVPFPVLIICVINNQIETLSEIVLLSSFNYDKLGAKSR